MALTIGTNCGFVTSRPSGDPSVSGLTFDATSVVSKFTSPAGATKITEIGWHCKDATEEANFELALYAADGSVVPGEAGTRLYVSATNAKGTGSGWKYATVDWTINPETSYWFGAQLDDTATASRMSISASGGSGYDQRNSQTTLNDPYGGGALLDSDGYCGIYAIYTATSNSASPSSSPSSSASSSPSSSASTSNSASPSSSPSSSASSSPSGSASNSPSSSASSSPSTSNSLSPSISASESHSPSNSASSSPSGSPSNSPSSSESSSPSSSPSSSASSSPSGSPSSSASSSPSSSPSSSVSASPSSDVIDYYYKIIPFLPDDYILKYDTSNDWWFVMTDEEIYKIYDDATYTLFLADME